MAVINPVTQVRVSYIYGSADTVALLSLRNVTAGDTVDVASWLLFINRAVMISTTSFVEIAAAWAGTVVTMPSGLANDAAYLLMWGSGAN